MKSAVVALAAVVAAIGFAPGSASATTIAVTNLGQVSPNTGGALLGAGVTETGSNNAPLSVGANPSDPSGWDPWGASDQNSHWLSVGGCCGGGGSYATFSFTSPADNFTLLWGSPNSDNTVTLYSGTNGSGAVVATISFVDGSGYYVNGVQTTAAFGPNTTDPGDIISIISSTRFLSAELTNTIGGFEVADISATAPLPSTWTMLIAGFVGLGFLAYPGSKRCSTRFEAI